MPRPFRLSIFLLSCALLAATDGWAADSTLAPGSKLDELTVGAVTYRQVIVRSLNARTIVITHAGGLASVRLRDLAPEWQARFHFDPTLEAAAETTPSATPGAAAQRPAPATAKPGAPKKAAARFDLLLQQFGRSAEVRPEVDLRAKFLQLELGVKNQGHRPSCAIFAVVSALEFQNAELAGRVEIFSEEYLIWAVRKTVQRTPPPGATAGGDAAEDADEGFALPEVVEALRAYGIPLQSTMPNTFGSKINAIEEPPAAIVEEARKHQRIFVHRLPGRDPATLINNLVQALNAGVPIPVGLAWPNARTLRTGYLSAQKPQANSDHAVTIVGYKCPTGRLEDTVFVFKNSWGAQWGQGGYGTVTYGYLSNYLGDAVVLEVQPENS